MIIDEFIGYLTRELNYSANTAAAYRSDLMQWAESATAGKVATLRPDDVTTADLRVWTASLAAAGASPASIRRKVQSLRSFFKYLMRYHGLAHNPASALRPAKIPPRLPLNVRPEETKIMLDSMESDARAADDFLTVRNHLIIELLYCTGMRCSELTGITDADADTMRCELKVHGKRNKDRIIPISTMLANTINRYRTIREADAATAQGASAAAPLIVSRRGSAVSRREIYKVVHDSMAMAGVHAQRLSPHVMRHSFATDMLNAGADLNSVRQILGHASLASTQVYTHISNRELQLNYQHAHPRAIKKGGQNGNNNQSDSL